MSAPKRKREVQLNFRVSPEELALIEQKMVQLGTKNREAYLRKMALDGYVVRLELPELKELVSLMRYSSNNLNQLTKLSHQTGFYRTRLLIEGLLGKLKRIMDDYRPKGG